MHSQTYFEEVVKVAQTIDLTAIEKLATELVALRETSVLFAALIGAVLLGEAATWRRYAAAAAVAVGIGEIALRT